MNEKCIDGSFIMICPWNTRFVRERVLLPEKIDRKNIHHIVLSKIIADQYITQTEIENIIPYVVSPEVYAAIAKRSLIEIQNYYANWKCQLIEKLYDSPNNTIILVLCPEAFAIDFKQCFEDGVDNVFAGIFCPLQNPFEWMIVRFEYETLDEESYKLAFFELTKDEMIYLS